MASISRNNIVRNAGNKGSLFPSIINVLSTSVTYNQGDILCYDKTNNVLKAITGSGDALTVVGVAIQKVVAGLIPSPYQGTAVDASAAIEDDGGPQYNVVADMIAKTSDALVPGCFLYPTATDPQTLTVTDPGNAAPVAIYQGPTIASAPAGQHIDALILCRYGIVA